MQSSVDSDVPRQSQRMPQPTLSGCSHPSCSSVAAVPGRLSAWKSEGAWSLPTSSSENSGNKEGVESENSSSGQLNGYFLRLKVQPLTLFLCQMKYK